MITPISSESLIFLKKIDKRKTIIVEIYTPRKNDAINFASRGSCDKKLFTKTTPTKKLLRKNKDAKRTIFL